jgi:hypothetical protein
VLPITEVEQAHRTVAKFGHVGKVLLSVAT